MFALDVASLDAGAHHLVRTPTPAALDLEPVPAEAEAKKIHDIEVVLDLFCEPRRILVHFEAHAAATLTCDRTLRPFEHPLEGTYSVLFATPEAMPPEAMPPGDSEGEDYEEVRSFSPADSALDLTDVVRDTLLLAVPQRKVAPGAEEEDLPTTFGASAENDAVDPRWEKLRQLREESG